MAHTNLFSSIRIRSPEPLDHTLFDENRLKLVLFFLDKIETYFLDFIIYIRNDADSDVDILLYDLYNIRLHIFYSFSYFGVGAYGGAM